MASELRAEDDGNTLVGYAAKFDSPTLINSWEGRFIEQIAPGAFKKTLKERGDKIKVLFNHGQDPSIGERPLGKPSVIREDGTGLYVEVPLDDTSYNQDLKASLASGAIYGMSFRFTVVREDIDESDEDMPVRTINEARLYEFGPVTFPAYSDTEASVRSDPRFEDLRRQIVGVEEPVDEPVDDVLPEAVEDTSDEGAATGTPAVEVEDAPPIEAPVVDEVLDAREAQAREKHAKRLALLADVDARTEIAIRKANDE
jgi:HK97 family phage prohead protease